MEAPVATAHVSVGISQTKAQRMQDRNRAEQLVRHAIVLLDRAERKRVLREALDLEIRAEVTPSAGLNYSNILEREHDTAGPEIPDDGHTGDERSATTKALPLVETKSEIVIPGVHHATPIQKESRDCHDAVISAEPAAPKTGQDSPLRSLKAKPSSTPSSSTPATPASSPHKVYKASPSYNASSRSRTGSVISTESETGRKRPKKLEVRALKQDSIPEVKRKPKKLEVRTKK